MVGQSNDRGFTLVELMIVVTIIGVLAVVAGTAYRRYMDAGRTSEAMAMLGEIRAKEEAYRAEFSVYAGWSSGGEAASSSLPQVDGATCSYGGSKEPCPKAVPTSGVWTGLGISAGKATLQCGYVLNNGLANTAPTGTIGLGLLGTPTVAWWYAIAICDNDGKSTTNATFSTASNTMGVYTQNEHQ